MKKDKDAFIKVLIVLVIASLSLLAIVYVMQLNRGDGGDFVNSLNLGMKEKVVITDYNDKFVVANYSDFNDEFVREKCKIGPWYLEDEKSMDFEGAGIKFKYLHRPISNDYLLMDNYTEMVTVLDGNRFIVQYLTDESVSYINEFCGNSYGSAPRFGLMITNGAIDSEAFDSKGEINKIEYFETIYEGFGGVDEIIERVVLRNDKTYTFLSSIVEERELEGEDGEMIHIEGFNGAEQLDYVFESLNFFDIEDWEKKDISKNTFDEFDNKGRLLIEGAEPLLDNFSELCQGSDWSVGEEKIDWYYNEKYQYKFKFEYTEFYNDALIVAPFRVYDDETFFLNQTVYESNGEYYYPCGPRSSGSLRIVVSDVETADEIKESDFKKENVYGLQDNLFEEIKVGKWDAVFYNGFIDMTGSSNVIVLLGEDYNYSFYSTVVAKEELLEMIDGFILVK